MNGFKQVTIVMPDHIYDELEDRAKERDISIVELFKRGVALDKYVWENRNGTLLHETPEGEVKKVVI